MLFVPRQEVSYFAIVFVPRLEVSCLGMLFPPRKEVSRGRFLNRVQVENFSSSKLEANKFIFIKFATCKFST
jgi:hypothetical protein